MDRMDEPLDKATVLNRLQAERARFEATLAQLTDRQIIEVRVLNEWTAKDILAHITAWECQLLCWLNQAAQGQSPDMPAPGTWSEYIEWFNAHAYAENRDRSLASVRAAFVQVYQQLVAELRALPEDPNDRLWSVCWEGQPPWGFIATYYKHYQEHGRQIAEGLEKSFSSANDIPSSRADPDDSPGSKKITVAESPTGLMLSYLWADRTERLLFIVFGVVLVGIVIRVGNHPVFWVPMIGVTVYWVAGQAFNQTIFHVTQEAITTKCKPLPWPGGRTVRVADIKELFCERYGDDPKSYHYRLRVVLANGKKIDLMSGTADQHHIEYLARRIREWLGLPNPPPGSDNPQLRKRLQQLYEQIDQRRTQ
jgi:hypothetical protein